MFVETGRVITFDTRRRSEHLADRLDPELLLAGVDVLADQRDGRSHCAAIDKPTRSSGSRWLFAALGPLSQAP